MTAFARGLNETMLAELRAHAQAPTPHWWKDLLARWRPAGSREAGLRLAVRDGYLNFYARGQSVAMVRASRSRDGRMELVAEIHEKYVWPGASGKLCATLRGGTVHLPDSSRSPLRYEAELLDEWILATERHQGEEKTALDALIAGNGRLFDTEVAWPTKPLRKIDLALLEPAGEQVKAVFVEVKTWDDPRLRARDGSAEVVGKLADYHRQLAARPEMAAACVHTCKTLVALRALATAIPPLDPLIVDVASGRRPLVADPVPRLLLTPGLDASGKLIRKKGGWAPHHDKLIKAGVKLVEIDDPRTATL